RDVIHEVVTGPSVLLMVSGILIGYIAGPERLKPVEPFFVSGFPGALVLFLFELGMVAAEELPVMLRHGLKLGLFAVLVPLFHGVLGVAFGKVAGLSEGGCGVLGTMAASASYIAAPAAVRIALPEANPSLYLGCSLGITFPFNLTLGIPLFFGFSHMLFS
ncbi:MAG: sodium-dependent bicarbonate transport family permease, partial [Candidatus Sumerlaeaceae bacterium]